MKHPEISNVSPSLPVAGVCDLTARGMAAISSIALTGQGARAILDRLFNRPAPERGTCVYGAIKGDSNVIDSVVAACEQPDYYVIHCHGNPLLVEQIVRQCCRFGAILQQPEDILFRRLRSESKTLIEAEARLAMTTAATLEGVELFNQQITGGLSAWATGWMESKSIDIGRLHQECEAIVERSRIARRILEGVRLALIGPPNSGKSTLLNWIAGQQEALVSDTAGTTRDWVSTVCRIGPLRVELFDTAGLDGVLEAASELDRAAQEAARQVMASCDLILQVCDCRMSGHKVPPINPEVPFIKVFTKSDVLDDAERFGADLTGPQVLVSAAKGWGLERLSGAILKAMQVDAVSNHAICFTKRQLDVVHSIIEMPAPDAVAETLRILIGEHGS